MTDHTRHPEKRFRPASKLRLDPIQNPQSKIKNAPSGGAFSLIELLVAIAVLSLMMTLAARIFYDAQEGVQRGLQTSQIIAQARSISQPLTKDVRSMNVFESKYGSNAPGFLIIHQAEFPNVYYPKPDEITDDFSTWVAGNMRSDQIAFFIKADKLQSLTPGQDDRYDSQAKARYARVWYGHAWPSDLTPTADTKPGDSNGPPQDGIDDYDLSSQMILGRQALLLVENDASTTYPGGLSGDKAGGGGTEGRVAPNGSSVEAVTFDGLHDVLDLREIGAIGVYDDGGIDPAATATRGLFRTPTFDNPTLTATTSIYGNAAGVPGGLPTPAYAIAARDWLYTTPGSRLRARTYINNDFSGGLFRADDIAELHTAFAPHVADFAIEFAADWFDDINLTTGTPVPGQDFQPDNEPDRDEAGNIVWYTLGTPNPDGDGGSGLPRGDGNYDGIGFNDPTAPVTYDARLISVSQFNGTSSAVHNTAPGTPPPFVYGNNIVWSHTGDALEGSGTPPSPPDVVEGCGKYWPYLIRFRYRLMDGRGEFRTVETHPVTNENYSVVGRFFEQVVPVPRPQGLY